MHDLPALPWLEPPGCAACAAPAAGGAEQHRQARPCRRVRIVTRDHSSYVEIRVEDDGNGLRPRDRPPRRGLKSQIKRPALGGKLRVESSVGGAPGVAAPATGTRRRQARGNKTPDRPCIQALPDNERMVRQRTLKALTRAVGVGIHSGQKVELVLRPAAPDTGIVFRRTDLARRWTSPCERPAASATAWPPPSAPAATRRPQGPDHRAPALGLRGPRPGQPLHRHQCRRGPHPRRLGGQLRLPAAVRRHRTAGRAQAFLRVKKTVEVRQGEGKEA